MTDRDITDLARELLAADTSAIGGNIIVDGVDVLETVRAAQKVAHAVVAVAEVADNLDSEADFLREMDADATDHCLYAHRIRAALNGKTR